MGEQRKEQFRRKHKVNQKDQDERRHPELFQTQLSVARGGVKRNSSKRKISGSSYKGNFVMPSISRKTTPHTTRTSPLASCASISECFRPESTKSQTARKNVARPHTSAQEIIIRLFREKWDHKRNKMSWRRLAHLRFQETMAVTERYNWYTKRKFFLSWIEGVIMSKREHQLELQKETRFLLDVPPGALVFRRIKSVTKKLRWRLSAHSWPFKLS
nr:unnamed protein product [Spirometra erinaceieuropaei]